MISERDFLTDLLPSVKIFDFLTVRRRKNKTGRRVIPARDCYKCLLKVLFVFNLNGGNPYLSVCD